MSITYEEALSTLSAMFSSPWTTESLDWILRHFEGHMENTVDAILTHGDGDPQVLISRLETGQDSTALDEELARSLAVQQEQQQPIQSSPTRNVSTSANQSSATELSAVGNAGISNATRPASSSARSNSSQQRGTPTTLPDDFLRIPGASYASAAATATTTDANTLATDEALARMLQDKLFAQELKNNPEFAHLARGGIGAPSADHVQWGFGNRSNPSQARDGPGVMEALAGMGEGAKRRLAELAQKVKTNVDRINQQNAQRGGGGGEDGFVPASERRGLLDLDDDDYDSEEISFARQDTDYEMRHMASSSGNKKSN